MALIVGTSSVSGPNGMTFALGDGGVPSVSVNGGPLQPIAGFGFGFDDETLAIAKALMPGLGFGRKLGTDFTPIWEAALSAANTPVIDIAREGTGGVVSFSGAGASSVALNPVTPGAATYNPILGLFACKCAGWLLRAKIFINATAFTAGTAIVLCSLDGSGVGGSGATNKIQIVSNPTLSPRQTYVRLQNTSGGPSDWSTGQDGYLGGPGSLLMPNQWTTVTLYFDGVFIRWMFGDQFNALNKLDATVLAVPASGGAAIGQLDWMPGVAAAGSDSACSVTMSSTDTTIGANFKADALAIAYCPNVEGL